METIHIFHTNDWHSHFAYWPRQQAYIQQQKLQYEAEGDSVFLCDVGDHMDRSSIFTEATLGKGNVQLLNEAGYDVVTIGNNEGITLSYEDLSTLYEEANFDVVVANLTAIAGVTPPWVKPYVIKETANGTKIGFMGATAPFEAFYKTMNWDVSGPREKIVQLSYYLRDKVDVLLFLSHLGINEDEAIAEMCPFIDVIFGAHTHHVLPHGKWVNDVLLTGGGMFGRYLGELTLQIDDNGQLHKKTRLHESQQLPTVEREAIFTADLTAIGERKMTTPLFETTRYYNKEWDHYSKLSDAFAKIILDTTNADCALFNAGIFLTDLKKGAVTALDLHHMLPHPINLCVVELEVEALKEVLATHDETWPRMALKGLGFRGVVLGKMLTYGMSLDDKRQLYINGQLAEPHKKYRLVTLDMFTFGYFYPQFKYAKKHYILPEFLREIVAQYGQQRDRENS